MGCIRAGGFPSLAGWSGFLAVALLLVPACEEAASDGDIGASGAGGTGQGSGDAAAEGEVGPSGDCGSDPADGAACTACLKLNCCPEWQACLADQTCLACSDCLGQEQSVANCGFDVCPFGSVGDPIAQLLSCGLANCEIECRI